MIRGFILMLCSLLPALLSAQEMLVPKWKLGDSLRYFLSESELIDNERISLKTYELGLRVIETNEKRSVLEGHLFLNAEKEQGEHWGLFYKLLRKVPFVFYFEPGRQKTFAEPIRLEDSKKAIDQILLELLDIHGLEPLAYGEISDWLASEGGTPIPDVLLFNFYPMDKIFDKYGTEISPSAHLEIADIENCADSALNILWNLDMQTYPSHDTLIQNVSMGLDSSIRLDTYKALNHCGKLKGLEVEVDITSYYYNVTERWAALLKEESIVSYAYDEEIRIGMHDIQNWQRVQKRIILLW